MNSLIDSKELTKQVLQEGPMTLKDLSIWFGLAPGSISNATKKTKEKKFKILETFADFHFEGRKLIIDKVKIPVYKKAYLIIEEEFPKHWGKVPMPNDSHLINDTLKKQRIDTCSRVGKSIYYHNPEVNKQISLNTTKTYTNKVKVKLYGHNYLDDHGTHGFSKYIWMNENGTAPLSAENLKTLNQCAQDAYGPIGPKIAVIDDEFKKGNLTKEERDAAVGALNTMDSYDIFINNLINTLGFIPEKRTQLIDNDISAW